MKYLLALIFLVISLSSVASSITRLQLRESNFGNPAWSQSTFIQFSNKFYFLDLFERQYQTPYQPWHLDINIGQTKRIIDWAARGQKYDGVTPVLSIGLQWNLINHKKIQSFIQVFPLKSNNALGRWDIVHYYSLPLSHKLSLRGYNQYIARVHQPNLFYPWADLIYSVNKTFDVYSRLSYLSSNDVIFGPRGFEGWIGIRINFIS